jgi:uncharacterized iron-regulated protein
MIADYRKPLRARATRALAVLACVLAPIAMARLTMPSTHLPDADQSILAVAETPVLALESQATIATLVPGLAGKRAVFIGEQHDRYDHHLIQLEFIRRLHAINGRIAIGMEAFQQPFQGALDDYVAGRISEEQMLRRTEYYQRWGVDYRMIAPLLRYARQHRLPVIALNVPVELTRQVAESGIAALPGELQGDLPEHMEPPGPAYRRRLEAVFALHPNSGEKVFDHFVDAQLLWDEGMAERAASFLAAHPDYQLVVLAGNQHVAWDDTIPGRLARRLPIDTATILNSWHGPLEAGLADYLLMPEQQALAPAGRIGVSIEEVSGGVSVASCSRGVDCEGIGIRPGDRIALIDDQPVKDIADLRLALWDRLPGDTVHIGVIRPQGSGAASSTYAVTLY